jgi:hypothetical protein
MVFKSIERIKAALPEVLHAVMFYNNGVVFQTTFDQEINVPKLGENIAEVLEHIRKVYNFCDFKLDPYKKLIFETENISMIILKLGEDSNIALFFEKEKEKELRISAIKRYLNRIEELIDMDRKELKLQEILNEEKELKSLNSKLEELKNIQENLTKEKEFEDKITQESENSQKLTQINMEIDKLMDQIKKKGEQIYELKKELEEPK